MSTAAYRSPIVVTHERGMRFAAQVRSHQLIVDQPRAAGGEDSGPTPLELLGVSLGSCVALYARQFLEARGIDSSRMRVEVQQHGARQPNRIGEFAVRIVLDTAIPETYRVLLERAARSCPAHHTLEVATPVHFTIDAPTEVVAA
jgi:putative redox protein